jgi:small subunit ribosomal protein S17
MSETPEQPLEPETPETLVDEVEAASGAGAGDPVAAAPAPAATRRERLEQRRAARRAAGASAGPKTLEERIAEREARRATNARQRRSYRAKQRAKRAEARAAAPAVEPDHAREHGPGRPKVRQGVVVSDKADKTLVVRIDVARRHKRYGKIMRTSTTLHVHDERNDAHAGDTVRVQESRPMSRTKRWRLIDVVERAR